MKLQGRNLSLQRVPLPPLQGDDVKLLQSELQQLGFAIPSTEVASATFGRATYDAVVSFQAKNALPTTGVVDPATAEKINAAVNALQPQRFVVQGQVRRSDGKPVGPTVVRAFAVTSSGESPLGEATTNAADGYKIEYTAAQINRSPGQTPGPDLIVRAFDPSGAVVAASTVIHNPGPLANIDLVIQAPSVPSSATFVVRGQVRQADFSLFVGALVQAFDKDLRGEELLGQAITDQEGRYEISYTADQFRRAEKRSADLIVRVYANIIIRRPTDTSLPAGQQPRDSTAPTSGSTGTPPVAAERVPLVTSPTIFNAPPIAIVDLVVGGAIYPGRSEYEEIVAELTPLLQTVPPVQPADLTAEDIAFLTGETGMDQQHIKFFVLSAQLSQKTELPSEVFYGFARENLPTELTPLLAQSPQLQRRALELALHDNIIPARLREGLDRILERLQRLIVESAFREPEKPGKPSLSVLLGTVMSDTELQKDFLTRYVQHRGSRAEFWKALREDTQFTPLVPRLQFTLQLAALTRNHLPLIKALQAQLDQGTLGSLSELAKLTEANWLDMINSPDSTNGGHPIGFPRDVPGEPSEKAAKYARILAGITEAAFPTQVIANRIANTNIDGKNELLTFFAGNPGFDVRANLDKYLADHPRALDRIANPEVLVDKMKSTQRLFKISPHFDDMQAMMSQQIESAHDIVRMGKDAFVEQFGAVRDQSRGAQLYERSAHICDTALALFGKYAETMNGINLPFAPGPVPDKLKGQIPDWANLFGAVDLCECEHCRSVYSPAAYLVDLLAFLDTVITKGKKSTRFLFADPNGKNRRGDIGEIQLTCQNTNTPLPYIDLVNEVLEYAVAGNAVPKLQTTRTAEELSVSPEHVLAAAYDDQLAKAVYPWDLPFNLAIEEARAFLEYLGVHRYDLMATCQRQVGIIFPSEIMIAVEYLGLTPVEHKIIDGTDAHQPWEYWGLQEQNNTLPDPTDPQQLKKITTDWLGILTHAFYFLERSKLSQQELLELLATRFVKNLGGISLQWPDTDCNMNKASIKGLTALIVNKLHRFLRLRSRLGWTISELDKVIHLLMPADLDGSFLRQVSYIQRFRRELSLSLPETLSWWGMIHTAVGADGSPSFYDQLFLNRAVTNPIDNIFALNQTGDQLDYLQNNPAEKITDHISVVAGGLDIPAVELLPLLRTVPPRVPDILNLENLSALYRIVSFARAARMSIADLTSLQTLSGIDPFDPSHVENAQRFLETANNVRGSGFTVTELNYLLRDDYTSVSGIAPTAEEIVFVLTDIREGLQKIARETGIPNLVMPVPLFPPPDPTGEMTQRELSIILPPEEVDQAMGLIVGAWAKTEPERVAFINEHFRAFLDETQAAIKLTSGELTDQQRSERFTFVLGPLLTYLSRRQSESLVKKRIGETLKLEAKTVELLFKMRIEPSRTLLEYFIDQTVIENIDDVSEKDPFLLQFKAFRLLQKAATMISKFKVAADELDAVLTQAQTANWLDLRTLPLQPPADPTTFFRGWERWVDLFGLRNDLPRVKPSLFDLFSETNPTKIFPAIAKITGWPAGDIRRASLALGLTAQNHFQDERGLVRLKTCFDLLKRLGVPVTQVFRWGQPELLLKDAFDIKNAIKARYDLQQWFTIAKPLQDIFREKQRSALVSFLTGRDRIDAHQLFDRYLIDVEMSPCQMTSRIKQAIGAVQLFVQRASMNLEQPVVLGDEVARQWRSWMRNYRVWEANRKVFLYPENWIEPDLRDDKTPFFKDLENELMQGDITPEHVENTSRKYLEKLDDVALLDIRGLCQEILDVDAQGNAHEKFHVFARTRGTPEIYYYRKRVDARYWTSWEKVDLDIAGDHLIPVVYDSRLYLFWPIFTKKADELSDEEMQKGTVPKKHLEVQLARSEYKNGKWSAKKITKEHIDLNSPFWTDKEYPQPAKQFFFHSLPGSNLRLQFGEDFSGEDDDLCILCRFQISKNGSFDNGSMAGWFVFGKDGRNGVPRDIDRFLGWIGIRELPFGVFVDGMEGIDFMTKNSPFFLPGRDPLNDVTVLGTTPGLFRLAYSHDFVGLVRTPLFYQDDRRDFFVCTSGDGFLSPNDWADPENADAVMVLNGTGDDQYAQVDPQPLPAQDSGMYRFITFYHPYVREFVLRLNHAGIDGLLSREIQLLKGMPEPDSPFNDGYFPLDPVFKLYPREEIDFTLRGAYSQYNWEMFFHVPLLIADRLSRNQRFEDAQRWFHYIFDPTDPAIALDIQNAWKLKPLKDLAEEPIQELMTILDYKGKDPGELAAKEMLEDQIAEWRKHPFDPHLIARHRLTAYQKTVVMKYMDNLIAWGDQLFRQDTIESINQATQLYVLAAELLGERPRILPQRFQPVVQTYNQLALAPLDKFSNALVQIEHWVPQQGNNQQRGGKLPLGMMLYFCIPGNDKLLGYWDIVADRLFKIRHCMNIEGMIQQLPLFEPPIDPALLMRAKATGVDLTSALKDINAALPHYRFSTTVQKAIEFCADVRALGASLLAALEKRDAETLARLRSQHELELLTAVRQVRERQIEEAQDTLDGLLKYRDLVMTRQQYYATRPSRTPNEIAHLTLMNLSLPLLEGHVGAELFAGVAHLFPDAKLGFPFTIGATYGGRNVGAGAQAFGSAMATLASIISTGASLSSTLGSYERRQDDWTHQADLASKELEQVDKQILAAQIRLDVAQKELNNHNTQIEHANEVDGFMHDRFTNEELYDWMVTQVAGIYFQSYQLAYDLAKRAEKGHQFERGNEKASFIQFGYWDSLKKGLLAGERLHYDLRRMEAAYLDHNKREYEMTKHISLVLLNPLALISLKEIGQCIVDLPEALFDMDYPGHYMRRIKNVTVTIPCVTGPYTSINCTLTLLTSMIRIDNTAADDKDYVDARHFVTNFAATQSIATSHAQSDSGMFELNFRDERYLPFEGAGVISQWRIEMPKDCNAFDFETISDVILNLNYTAREGGKLLAEAARKAATLPPPSAQEVTVPAGPLPIQENLLRLFSLKHEFSNEWYRFLHPPEMADTQTLQLNLTPERFPFQFRGRTIEISEVELFLKFKETYTEKDGNPLNDYLAGGKPGALRLYVTPPGRAQVFGSLDSLLHGLPHANVTGPNSASLKAPLTRVPGKDFWLLEAKGGEPFQPGDGNIGNIAATLQDEPIKVNGTFVHHLKPEVIEDIYMVCHYSAS